MGGKEREGERERERRVGRGRRRRKKEGPSGGRKKCKGSEKGRGRET